MAAFTSSSSPGSEQLCQLCGTRPARNHLCQIINGQQTTLDLCEVCIRTHTAQSGFDLPTLDGALCFYCGGVATSASMNQTWEVSSRQQRYHYTCFRCSELFHEFITEALSSIPDGLPPEQQLQRIEQITRDTDQRVRDRVRSDAE
jgi:hypothetical protein